MGDFSIFAFRLSGGSISCLPGQAIVIEYSGSCLENSSTVRRKAEGVRGYSIAECRMPIAEFETFEEKYLPIRNAESEKIDWEVA
jgi:hypothetical protein